MTTKSKDDPLTRLKRVASYLRYGGEEPLCCELRKLAPRLKREPRAHSNFLRVRITDDAVVIKCGAQKTNWRGDIRALITACDDLGYPWKLT